MRLPVPPECVKEAGQQEKTRRYEQGGFSFTYRKE